MNADELREAVSAYLRERKELAGTFLTLEDLEEFRSWIGEGAPSAASCGREFRRAEVRLDSATFTLVDEQGRSLRELLLEDGALRNFSKNHERVQAYFELNSRRING